MEVVNEIRGNTLSLRIKGEMTIYAANELKQHLAAALHANQDLEIDLSAVLEMDTSGLQLLFLAKREAQRADKRMTLVNHSPASMQVLDMFNMSAYFGDPVVIPARPA